MTPDKEQLDVNNRRQVLQSDLDKGKTLLKDVKGMIDKAGIVKKTGIKKLPIKEADITKQIRDYLNYKHIFHWKQFQTLGSKKGVSDIIGCINGKFFSIEVKVPGGLPTNHQVNFMAAVRSADGIAFVAYSIEEVQKNLMI